MKDFSHSGLGIGGLGRHVEDRLVPTIKQMERLERLENQSKTCSKCNQSDVFDGVMFTVDPARRLCDDCFG